MTSQEIRTALESMGNRVDPQILALTDLPRVPVVISQIEEFNFRGIEGEVRKIDDSLYFFFGPLNQLLALLDQSMISEAHLSLSEPEQLAALKLRIQQVWTRLDETMQQKMSILLLDRRTNPLTARFEATILGENGANLLTDYPKVIKGRFMKTVFFHGTAAELLTILENNPQLTAKL